MTDFPIDPHAPSLEFQITPVECCGNWSPAGFGGRVECVLRPGHSGSHADDRGARWTWNAETGQQADQPPYPYSDGTRAVLGPDVTASADGMTITWQGSVYHRHPLTPCTCRQAVHAREHASTIDGCPWCSPAPDIRPPRPSGVTAVDARLLGEGDSGPSVSECAANDRRYWADKYAGEAP